MHIRMFFYVLYSLRLLLCYSNTMLICLKQKWYVAWKHDLDWSLYYCIGHLPASPLNRDKLIVHQASHCCCCNAHVAKSAATGSAGWQAIKLQSPHWYQQTSLSILVRLWLHCVQCTCSCKQTHVGIHMQIIPLTRNVLRSSMQIDGIIQ